MAEWRGWEGMCEGEMYGGGVGCSNSEEENPPKAASPSWVGVGVGIWEKEGVEEGDEYKWGGEAPNVSPVLGG